MTPGTLLFALVLGVFVWALLRLVLRHWPRRDDDASGFDTHGDLDDEDRK